MILTQADVNDCFRNAATRIKNTIGGICDYYDEKGEFDSVKIGREIDDYKKMRGKPTLLGVGWIAQNI